MRMGSTSVWVEVYADRSRLGAAKPDRPDDENSLIVYMWRPDQKPIVARKWQLGNGHLYDEGIDWCYADDDDAVAALRAARALG